MAIVPVILFHAGFNAISGGFSGVDVFFVISGFLISKIIITEISAGKFSFGNFYERRLRRIAPALIAVLLVTHVAMWIASLPTQLVETGKSGLAALFAVSNIYFWSQSGYFAPASEFQPFLHTWSLGVEEQFYFIMPFALLALNRLGLNLKWTISLGVVLFFIASVWLSYEKPSGAFFLLPARVWELGLGSVLALQTFPALKSGKVRDGIGYLGAALLFTGIFALDSSMTFPGFAALLPCLGAACIIYAGQDDRGIGKILSLRGLRFIGLVSYSWYLWHWPVFVFLRMMQAQTELSLSASLFGILLSFLLAIFSWKFVETPFRNRRDLSLPKTAGILGLGTAGFVAIASAAILLSGAPSRINNSASQALSAKSDIDEFRSRCKNNTDMAAEACLFGSDTSTQADFVLVGDSHAAAIRPAIEVWAQQNERRGVLSWSVNCPLLVDTIRTPAPNARDCSDHTKTAMERIIADTDIKTVFLGGRWEATFSGRPPEIGGSYRTFLIDEQSGELSDANSKAVFTRGLTRTITALEKAGKEIVILGAVPEPGFDVPMLLALSKQHSIDASMIDKMVMTAADRLELDAVFSRLTEESTNGEYISIWANFCPDSCRIEMDGVPFYSDDDHLTKSAARDFVGPILLREISAK